MSSKRCFKCQQELPRTEFYAHKMMGDGLLGKCKSCTKSDVAAHRAENIESVRSYDRARANLPHRVEQRYRIVKAWAAQHPDRKKAQAALKNAVRDGRALKWPTCALAECDGKPEAHHPDYSRPLDVVWLCSAHHKQAHALTRRILSGK